MAKPGKFGALADFRAQPEAAPPEPQVPTAIKAPIAPMPAPAATPGRPRGKRSDPAYKGFTVYLRRSSHKKAAAILAARDDEEDLSEVMQRLLDKWIDEQP